MKEPSQVQLENEIVQTYLALGDAIRVAILPDWIVADLSMSQLKALMLLTYHGALTVSALARLLNMGNPAASILVQQLVDQKLVERSEDAKDRRRTLVELTPQGAQLIIGRHKQTETKLRQWLSQMGEDELTRVVDGLNTLAKAARVEQAQRVASSVTEVGD